MTDSDRDGRVQAQFKFAEQAYERGDALEALEKFQQVRCGIQSGMLYNASSEYIGHILSDQGEFEDAFDVLYPIEKNLSSSGVCLIHRLAYFQRNSDMIVYFGDRAFEAQPIAETAFINALGNAMLGRVKPAVGWLKSAQREGMELTYDTLVKTEFDAIRSESEFERFSSQL